MISSSSFLVRPRLDHITSSDLTSSGSPSIFLKKEELRVVYVLPFVAVTIDPLTFATIRGVGSYGVDHLFLFSCFTSAKSPFFIVCSLVLLFSSNFSFCFALLL